jgi:hypothetical protein
VSAVVTEQALTRTGNAKQACTLRKGRTIEDVDRALTMLALVGGNCQEACRRLKAAGHTLSPGTLEEWRKVQFPQRYEDLCRTQAPKIEEKVAQELREFAVDTVRVQRQALAKTSEQLEGDKVDAASVMRNVAVSGGIAIDQILKIEGRPTQIVEHKRDAAETLALLAQKVPGFDIESTATELPEGDQ